jgi:hypothetical protein
MKELVYATSASFLVREARFGEGTEKGPDAASK